MRSLNKHCILLVGQIFFLEKVASEEGDESFPKRFLLRNYRSGLGSSGGNEMESEEELNSKKILCFEKESSLLNATK